MGVPRGTTPTFTLSFEEGSVDLTEAANVYVTFRYGIQRNRVLTKTGEDLDVTENTIDVYLNQEETLAFEVGNVEIQVNWTYTGGGRASSEVVSYAITKQLLNEVLE